MEVHHSHHPGHKKKWAEYLLEFLMLFLAVFLGFTAENIREHKIERHREKDYIHGIVQNLKDDTMNLNKQIPVLETRIQKMDSLLRFARSNFNDPANLRSLYRLSSFLVRYTLFTSNTATIAQLKSGNLRLIQKDHAADSIMKYDITNDATNIQWEMFFKLHILFAESYQHFMDMTYLVDSTGLLNHEIGGMDLPPVSEDKELRKVFFNNVVSVRLSSNGYLTRLKYQLSEAERLLGFLKNRYSIKD